MLACIWGGDRYAWTSAASLSLIAGGRLSALGVSARADIIHGVQTVFVAAAPIAALALVIVLLLREEPLKREAARPSASPNASSA
jgi:hypothetical protein